MGKKAQPFMIFVKEYQTRNNIRSLDKAKNDCSPIWNSMTDQEKEPYKDEAEAINLARRAQVLEVNRVLEQSEGQQEQRERIYDPDMRKTLVEKFVNVPSVEDLIEKDIYILTFNVMCKTYEGEYFPIEVGLVRYSIKEGIKGWYHAFIDGGDIPVGYACEAREHMEKYHKIPLEGFSLSLGGRGQNRKLAFDQVVEVMDNFIQPERITRNETDTMGVRPVFTYADQNDIGIHQTRGCLKKLSIESGNHEFYDSLEVLDLVYLHFHLCKYVGQLRPLGTCNDDLSRTSLDYTSNCDFHEEVDTPHCALGKSRRLALMLSDILCSIYKINPTPNHLPKENIAPITFETYQPPELGKPQSRPGYVEGSMDQPVKIPNAWTNKHNNKPVSKSPKPSTNNQAHQAQPQPKKESPRSAWVSGQVASTSNSSDFAWPGSSKSDVELLVEDFPALNIRDSSNTVKPPGKATGSDDQDVKKPTGIGRGRGFRKR